MCYLTIAYILSPNLTGDAYLNFLEHVLHELLVYADDVNVLEENLQTVRKNTEIFIKASKDIGLEINFENTKIYDHISTTKYSRPTK